MASYLADLHVHSRYSRATSRDCTLEKLHHWAQLKGVTVVGTGDFTHPAWFAELRAKLVPAAPGLYQLRPEVAGLADPGVPDTCRAPVRFLLTAEISSIYKRDGRVRKVHSLVLAPVHGKQVLTYLRLLNQPLGLLINFGAATFKEGVRRIVNSHTDFTGSHLRINQVSTEPRHER